MGRIPCCEKDNVKRGQWTPEEDNKLSSYIAQHGTRNWRLIPKNAGLCLPLWSLIANQLPGRTDNDVKNHWNTKLKKKLSGMGIDPVTHKPFSHLMAEIATTLAPPQVTHLAEAALGCFKDEMLHLLTKKRIDFQLQQPNPNTSAGAQGNTSSPYIVSKNDENDETIEKIKLSLSRAMQEPGMLPPNKPWEFNVANSANFAGECSSFPASVTGFQCGSSSFGEGAVSPWSQSMCTGSTCTAGDQQGRLHEKLEDENGEESEGGKEIRNGSSIFNTECVLWDLPSDDLMNPIV
ncbi:hypothetical protein JCGZ_09543 [Jatropha curcas]|uniref:Uncharacterized protein n=1 Tax=Jatropha curcas TaxID=180498 RepID=A0A067KMW7_JATCU|nr:hypothetical protein JCGZ_09543 [Jatropha curcas]